MVLTELHLLANARRFLATIDRRVELTIREFPPEIGLEYVD